MSKFLYTVKNINGQTISDVADAVDQEFLIEHLQRQGYFILSIKPQNESVPEAPKIQKNKNERKFTHNRVRLDDLLIFARQLATMLDSGVSLMRSLDVISSQVESKSFYIVLTDVKKQV